MRQAMLRFGRSALALVGACALGAPTATRAAAQAPSPPLARLQGVVIDAATYQPVDSAAVVLVGSSASVMTEPWGTFELEVPVGQVALQVTAPAHATVLVDVEVHEDRPVFVRIVLPTFAVTLSEILVQAKADDRPVDAARTAADLVAEQIPRTRVNSGQVGRSDFDLSLRLATSFSGPQAPTIVVDGVILSRGESAFEALERIPAADVEEVQVLRGPSAAFLYPFAANGVIVVTTRRGPRP